jgi:hypothetical protein
MTWNQARFPLPVLTHASATGWLAMTVLLVSETQDDQQTQGREGDDRLSPHESCSVLASIALVDSTSPVGALALITGARKTSALYLLPTPTLTQGGPCAAIFVLTPADEV